MLKHSSTLRLHTNAQRIEGRLVLPTTDTVEIRGAGGELRVPLTEVDSLWVRRHYIQQGFLLGVLLGAGGYVAVTSIIDADEGDSGADLDNLFGGLVWAGSAVLGTVVGRLIPRWKRVFP
jgi:hypothetical protein